MASCPGTLTAATAAAAAAGAVVVTTSCREYLNPLLRRITVHSRQRAERMLRYHATELHTVSTTFAYRTTLINFLPALCAIRIGFSSYWSTRML